jgi:hypothetical protein
MKTFGFETQHIEYLNMPIQSKMGTLPSKRLIQEKIKQAMKDLLRSKGFIKSDVANDRCLFHLIYRGYDQESFVSRYWEKTDLEAAARVSRMLQGRRADPLVPSAERGAKPKP